MIEDSDRKIGEKILQFSPLEDRRVLEVGCGSGRITSLLADLPEILVAVEPDEVPVRHARSHIADADFIRGEGEHLALPDSCFDVILFTLSLHHHRDCRSALSEAGRVLKDGGRILVIEPAAEGEVERFFMLVHDETEAKLQARDAIKQSGMIVECSEIFSAQWVFENGDELCRSLFDYYGMAYCVDTAAKIFDLLGARRDSSPVVLMDSLEILALKKSV